MQIIKTISKISVTVLLFLLIISKPVVSDYATRIKYSIDTNVVTYEERKFILDNYPKYYIDYIDNIPYILTNIKYINKWNIKEIGYAYRVNYKIIDNYTIFIINIESDGYLRVDTNILPSESYILTFNADVPEDTKLHNITLGVYLENATGQTTLYIGKLKPYNEFYIETLPDTKELWVFIKNSGQDYNITLSNFILRKADDELINRPAKTYIKEHAPYDYIGNLVIGGFMDLVAKINKPKEFIKELTSEAKEFVLKLIL